MGEFNPLAAAALAGLFTYAMTAIGAGAVFLSRQPSKLMLDVSLGFAGGVMVAASFWSLLAPAIAMSEHLSRHGVQHVVLERNGIAQNWRSARWDSLVTNGPAWHDRFPGLEFSSTPDGFPAKDEVADYLQSYAQKINAPIHTGVEVQRVTRNTGHSGFQVETTEGNYAAQRVVVATGAFQVPVIPAIAPQNPDLLQMHSSHYRNPAQLPAGAVLVVGAGSSGVQIADELPSDTPVVFFSFCSTGST